MDLPVYAKIDLTSGKIEDYNISEELFKNYIGGKALGARLLMDLTRPGIDPLSPEALIIINTGPMNGTGAPSTSRFNLTFKNVMTGGIASSNCGGTFGIMLKRAGYDGLMITGRSEKPCSVFIEDGSIRIESAESIWGLDTEKAQQALPSHYGKLVIGPAGENLVRYASAASGERMAGRCGCGAVLGSKNLKALAAFGTAKTQIAEKEKFDAYLPKWVKFIKSHPMTGKSLPNYGSAGLVNKANATFALPTRNFQAGHYDKADRVSGETLAETRLTRNSGCVSCPIRCERRAMVDGREVKGPEYETLGFFGPNIDASDLDKVLKLNYVCDILGMDTISAASTIAFAMELKEKGMADLGVAFGDVDSLEEVLNNIAYRKGSGDELANGSKWLSEKYGGKEFAMNVKGLEMASYEPRRSVGMGLGYATANRGGCHLNGGYLALLESVGVLSMDALTPKCKAELTVFLQNALEAVSTIGCCLFSAQTFVPSIFFKLGPTHAVTRFTGKILPYFGGAVSLLLKFPGVLCFNSKFFFPHTKALSYVLGKRFVTGDFIKLGERCYNMERAYNVREGIDGSFDKLPERLTNEPQQKGRPETVVPMDKMLPKYYRVRGWDDNGTPKASTLKRLGVY